MILVSQAISKAEEVSIVDNKSIQHTRWNCTYHIVFIPKYRRKIMYGELKRDLVEILKKLCEMKQVQIIEGKVCKDHIHMYVAIPPKMSVSDFMSYLKGKSTLMLFDRHPEYRQKWADRHFWARGYYVSTVGNVNEETIIRYLIVGIPFSELTHYALPVQYCRCSFCVFLR